MTYKSFFYLKKNALDVLFNDLLVITNPILFFEFDNMGQIRDEILLKKIVGRIKVLREEKGLTLEEFYNDTNIHIARIESAHTNITVSTLNAICKYLGISIQDFFKNL